jgi:hypothetical protein
MDIAANLRKAYIAALTGVITVYDSQADAGAVPPYAVVTDVDYEPIYNKSMNFYRATVTLELYEESIRGGGMSALDNLAGAIAGIIAPVSSNDLVAVDSSVHVGAKLLSMNNDRQATDSINIFRKICRFTHYITTI